ncbi:MAG: OmpA family protein [Acidiferrobacterales bacterium]|nr:OmpA family protein [Acidiferrobacterales bacterium]
MKRLAMLLSVVILAGCASQEIPEPPPKEPNEIIIEEIRESGLSAWETDLGVEIFLPDLLFEINKAELSERAAGTLNVVADIIQKDITSNRMIVVSGHTDATGSEDWNMKLSKKRAMAVVDALLSHGVEEERIETKWFGESVPKVQNFFADGNYNVAGQSINRRVEVVILNSATN